jgi:ferredoxin
MSRSLRRIRRASQLLFLIFFLLLFASAGFQSRWPVPFDLFLRADPLVALSSMLSVREVIPSLLLYALPVTVLSLFLGRAFCGWICPMGTVIDASDRICGPRRRKPESTAWRRVKFYLLIALLVTMLLPATHRSQEEFSLSNSVGLSAVYTADPIVILTRTLTLVGLPAGQWLGGLASNTAFTWADSPVLQRLPILSGALETGSLRLGGVTRPEGVYFRLGAVAFPLGALLGLLGRLSPVRLRVSEECTRCMRCVSECKVGAITDDPKRYRGPECISCYTCINVCPVRAVSLTVRRADSGRGEEFSFDRRHVLGAIGAGVAAVVLPRVDWGSRRSQAGQQVLSISSERLIRPPGSLPEQQFATACVRCGECMKICPTNGLQPALGEGGLAAVGTPILVPRIGTCLDLCNACWSVCPTGAIRRFEVSEKRYLYLGTAVVDRSKCIAWAHSRQCMVCDEACSYDAIHQDMLDDIGRPVVDDRICVGCGQCEAVCPVEPRGAIRVSSAGDRRHLRRGEQLALRDAAPDEAEGEGGLPYPEL